MNIITKRSLHIPYPVLSDFVARTTKSAIFYEKCVFFSMRYARSEAPQKNPAVLVRVPTKQCVCWMDGVVLVSDCVCLPTHARKLTATFTNVLLREGVFLCDSYR